MGGVCAALDIVTLHDDSVIWKEIVDSACDPKELRAYAKREGLLEVSGFTRYTEEYKELTKEASTDAT